MQAGKRRWRIGVFIEWLSDGYSDPIFDAIVCAAAECDVDILCFVGSCDERDFPVASRHMPAVYASSTTMDGAVVVSMGNAVSSTDLEKYFERLASIPLCGVAVQWSRFPSVDVDNETGVRAGMRHLIRTHGRRKLACIRGPASSTEADKRFAAYRDVLEEFGITYDPAFVTLGHYIREHGVEAVRVLLDDRKLEVDAIVAANDAMALGALEELERRGIAVPSQVSLFGFDDIDEGRHARPPLTTVRQPVREHGRKAFEIVLEQLKGNSVSQRTEIDSDLILRKSCGCAVSRGHLQSFAPPSNKSSSEGQEIDTWLVDAAQKLVAFLSNDEDPHEEEAQLEALLRAVAKTGDGRPLVELMELNFVRLSRNRSDLLLILPQLDAIRQSCRGLAAEANASSNLDHALLEISILASEMAERYQAQLRYGGETQINRLLRMNEALLQTRSFDEVAKVIAEQLSPLGIGGCYVCTWEGHAVPAETARLVLACAPGHPESLPPDGIQFLANELLPQGVAQTASASAWLVCPMARRDDNISGYIVLIRGTAESFVYDGLVDQIASNFKRLELTRQVVEEVRLRETAERERIEREMRIASEIQTGILPREFQIAGLDISCSMRPATEVGGDYYDVIATPGGCWLGIGDVAGHGLPTGLVMLMCQSVLGGLTRSQPDASPARLLSVANQLLYDNIRQRMHQDEHITLALIRYHDKGFFEYAGAHEALLIWRESTGRLERIEMDGVWSGILEDIEPLTKNHTAQLCPGDLMVLYTDGITEARNIAGEVFGEERLATAIESFQGQSVDAIRSGILQVVLEFAEQQDDDMTLVVARYRGAAAPRLATE